MRDRCKLFTKRLKMNKNKIIKENLENHISNSIKLFNHEFSFPKIVQQELNNLDNITWLPNSEININLLKEKSKSELNELLNDNQLHSEIDNLVKDLIDINNKTIQDNIEHQLVNNLTTISQNILDDKNNFELNLLFLEHDYEPEACFCGFDDDSYKYKLLSGQEYLEYDYKKELFNGAGRFDYTNLLSPYIKFINELGEEKVEMINEALTDGMYLEQIKNLFLLNGFLGIHLCLNNIKSKIREIHLPMKDEVFIFGNEHDCEEINIYVL